MTINTDPSALTDLFQHVISGRANVGDIDALIGWLQDRRQALFVAKLKPGWVMPAPPPNEYCFCGEPINTPVAYNSDDGWELVWDCTDMCGDVSTTGEDKFYIDWPFVDETTGNGDDLIALGFTLM